MSATPALCSSSVCLRIFKKRDELLAYLLWYAVILQYFDLRADCTTFRIYDKLGIWSNESHASLSITPKRVVVAIKKLSVPISPFPARQYYIHSSDKEVWYCRNTGLYYRGKDKELIAKTLSALGRRREMFPYLCEQQRFNISWLTGWNEIFC